MGPYDELFHIQFLADLKQAVGSFVEERCQQCTPNDVFAMDICLSGDEYFIVECGCMNGVGFYKANIESIVANVTEYFVATV